MPVNPELLGSLIRKYGREAVKKAVDLAKAKVEVPNMTGTASAASTSLGSIPKVESTVGREAGVAAAALASPGVLASIGPELAAQAPLWGNIGKEMAFTLPSFEAVDRAPALWGGERLSETAGELAERGVRSVMPDGKVEDVVASGARMAAPFLVGIPEGVASNAIMKAGVGAGLKIGKAVEKKLSDLAAKKDWEAFRSYAKENGLGIAKDSQSGHPVLLGQNGQAYYLKDGKLNPVEGEGVSSAKLGVNNSQWDQKAWDNWVAGHEKYFNKAAGYPKNPDEAFQFIPLNEWDKVAAYAEDTGMSIQQLWDSLAKLNAAHKADPMLKYKDITKDKFPNISDDEFKSIYDEGVFVQKDPEWLWFDLDKADTAAKQYDNWVEQIKGIKKSDYPELADSEFDKIIDEAFKSSWSPEQTKKNLSYAETGHLPGSGPTLKSTKNEKGLMAEYMAKHPSGADWVYYSGDDIDPSVGLTAQLEADYPGITKYVTGVDPKDYYNKPIPPKYPTFSERQESSVKAPPSIAPHFDEHGPWEIEHPLMYPNAASDTPINAGKVWDKPFIRVSQPLRQSIDEVIAAASEGRTAPLQTITTDIFGKPVQLPRDWAAFLRTEEGAKSSPTGYMYAWKGNPAHELYPGKKSTKYPGDPYWGDVYMGRYPSLFSGEYDLAKTYTGQGYKTASTINYSTEGGAPNLLLLAYPKQPIYDTGVDLEMMHWNALFDPTPENMALWRPVRDRAIAEHSNPTYMVGADADAYREMVRKNPFKLKGYGKFTSVDEIADFLDRRAPEFGYNGVLMRGIEDNEFGTGAHGEFIWNPKHGGYPKALHPANTLELNWGQNSYLRKYGGSIHIKPSKRGTFTAAATKHGKSVQAFASQVLAHPENYSSAMVKKANFARNFGGHKHEDGGFLHEYPDGGRIRGKQNGRFFVTELSPRREKKFQDWYAGIAPVLGLDPNPDAYEHAYDYRGYWLNNRDADVSSPDFHFPDTWKQPHHPTFSNESIYAKGREGVGHWEGDTFVPGPFNNLMQATEPSVQTAAPTVSSNYSPSEGILNYIKDIEQYRGDWYQDGNGVWTVGYGFTGDDVRKRFPNGMTRDEADRYFADTVSRRIPMFISATPNFDKLNQNQRDALFSYYYNIGHGGYTRKSPAMQKALEAMDLDTVVKNIDFGYNDSKNRGLRKRRDYERNLFGTPMDYGGYMDRLRKVYGDNESIKAAILRAKNKKKGA